MIKSILKITLTLVILIVFALFTYTFLFWDKDYSSEFPVDEDLIVNIDSSAIARGKHLVYGPAHCAHCHSPFDMQTALERGAEVPLTGGFGMEIEPGIYYAPNITMDKESGIGSKSDGQLYRALRHNVMTNGSPTIEFMPFVNMSDEDIFSIIAYLRTTDPLATTAPETKLNTLGKSLYAFGVIEPQQEIKHLEKSIKKEASIEYGKYLAEAVANCRGCHTTRDYKTGEYIGEYYAGGQIFGPHNLTQGWTFISPNLTPDPETGTLKDFTEEKFVERMKMGRVHALSPMPWAAFARMDETEIKAIYKYLNSLAPVKNKVKIIAIPPKDIF